MCGDTEALKGDVRRRKRCATISIVTVVYNNRDGFRRTADSICGQSSDRWEWIVVDGGSTDGTVDAIREIADRITFWCSERDGGIYDAMNKGLAQARGDFVVFMNSGDRFGDADTIAKVCAVADQADANVGMILGAARFELSQEFSYVQRSRPLTPYIYHSLPTSHQAMFFSTKLHRRVPFNVNMRIAADYDAICRMYRLNPNAAYLDDVVALVWRGLDSNSLRYPIRNLFDMASAQRRVLGVSYTKLAASMIKRILPALLFRAMSVPWAAGPLQRLILMLRPNALPAVAGHK